MSKLIFTADKSISYDARLSTLGPNQIRIVFNEDTIPDDFVVYSGFVIVNEHSGIVCGDYTDYTYKLRDTGEPHTFDVSNSRMPYTPNTYEVPEKGEVIRYVDENQPEDGVVTFNKDSILAYVDQKISELSEECKESIENGVGIIINGELKHFSYSLEKGDQNNVDDMFNTMMQTNIGQYYHADGEPQTYFEPYQIFNIYSALKLRKLNIIAKYNQLALMLRDMFSQDKEYDDDDIEYLDQVSLRKTKLKGDFHKNYVANKTQNEDQMEAIKQKLIANGIEFPPEEKEAESATE